MQCHFCGTYRGWFGLAVIHNGNNAWQSTMNPLGGMMDCCHCRNLLWPMKSALFVHLDCICCHGIANYYITHLVNDVGISLINGFFCNMSAAANKLPWLCWGRSQTKIQGWVNIQDQSVDDPSCFNEQRSTMWRPIVKIYTTALVYLWQNSLSRCCQVSSRLTAIALPYMREAFECFLGNPRGKPSHV